MGIANAFAFTSRRSLTLHLIEQNKASASTATDYIGLGICSFVGPSLSGFIIKEIGSGYTQIIISLFSFAALLTLLQIINADKKTASSIKEKGSSKINIIINDKDKNYLFELKDKRKFDYEMFKNLNKEQFIKKISV